MRVLARTPVRGVIPPPERRLKLTPQLKLLRMVAFAVCTGEVTSPLRASVGSVTS